MSKARGAGILTAWSKAIAPGLLILLSIGLVGIFSLPFTTWNPAWLIDIEQENTWDVMLTEQDPIHDIYLFSDTRLSIEYLRTNGSPISIELNSDREGGKIVLIRNVTEISGIPVAFLSSGEPDIIRCSLKREANNTSVEIRSVVVGHYVSTDFFYTWIHPFSLLGLVLTYFSLKQLSARKKHRGIMLAMLFVIIASALMTPMYLYHYNGDYHPITKEKAEALESYQFELNSSFPTRSLDVPVDVVTDAQWLRIEVFTRNASVLSRFATMNGSDVLILSNLAVAAPNHFAFDIGETTSTGLTCIFQTFSSEAEINVTYSAMTKVVEPQVDSAFPTSLFYYGGACLGIGILIAMGPNKWFMRNRVSIL